MRKTLRGMLWVGVTVCLHLAAQAQVTFLNADGPGNTYQLLSSILGGEPYEVPDCDHGFGEHIREAFDKKLNAHAFEFFLHRSHDTDRCKTNVDRQRNEIKTYAPSAEHLKGTEGETVTYTWKFKLEAGFQPSASFTHIFQLKASGGEDDASPVLTFTPRVKGNAEILALIYSPGSSVYHNLQEVDLAPFKGEWVEVYLQATLLKVGGSLNLSIRRLYDNQVLLAYKKENSMIMWRDGFAFVRPKWGIYRSLKNEGSLRDEKVSFANFVLTEGTRSPAPVGKTIVLKTQDQNFVAHKEEGLSTLPEACPQGTHQFLVEDAGEGMVALKARNGKYLSVDKKTGKVLGLDPKVKKGNKFEWVDLGNQRSLLRNIDGPYLEYDQVKKELRSTSSIATEGSILSWEAI